MSYSQESFGSNNEVEFKNLEGVPRCRSCGETLSEDSANNPAVHEGCCDEKCAKEITDHGGASYTVESATDYYEDAVQEMCIKFDITKEKVKESMKILGTTSAPYIEQALTLMQERGFNERELRSYMDSEKVDTISEAKEKLEESDAE